MTLLEAVRNEPSVTIYEAFEGGKGRDIVISVEARDALVELADAMALAHEIDHEWEDTDASHEAYDAAMQHAFDVVARLRQP